MTRPRRITWRTALVAVALVAGLFALHALSHHGEHLPSATAAVSHHDHAADHHQSAPADSHDHGALTLCLAMLAGAGVWLLATAVRRRGSRPLVVLPRGAVGGVRLRATGRAHAPPGRWDLSVCRC
ncbi:hypothetical protein GCM10009623_12140 [Nocardioides aestuarii]|uniref:DUF2946 domain-containing protein n=1 Tax=Nocardioides aestuarii TaxID=252231 RepID=A0ABW4TL35_9ACTN